MAKKNAVQEVAEEREAIQNEDDDFGNGAEGAFAFDTDFDVADEFKMPPLVPAGAYEGFITNVHFDAGANALLWDTTLRADDDVTMSDNETPVNGVVLIYKNWFPKAGDESERTKTGKMTKRQAKINMIQDFSKKMRINMNTPQDILDAVEGAEWIGLEVIATVEVREWEGRLSNQIKDIKAA